MLSASILYGLISMFGYGILNILNSKAAKTTGAYRLGFLVQTLGFLLTTLMFPIFGKLNMPLNLVLLLSIPGILSAITYLTFMKAFEKGSVAIVMPIVSSWSIITALLSFIFLKEKIIATKIVGIVLTVLGVIILSTNLQKLFKEKAIKLIAGAEWAGATSIGWGINFFLVSFFSKKLGWYLTNIGLRVWVTIALLIITFFLRKNIPKLFFKIPKIIYLIVILDVIFYIFLNAGLEFGEASIVSVLASAAPVVSIMIAVIFMRERLVFLQKMGIILSLGGILILSFAK